MKRRLTAAALALIFPLSMAACGSQSTADACKEISTARTSVHQYSAEHSILSMPFSEVPDHLKKLLDMYRDAGKKVSNKEVKPALDKVITDLETIKDFDFTTLNPSGEQMEAMTTFASDALQLNNICGISAGTK